MKNIGKVILTVIASLLVLAVPVAIAWKIWGHQGKNTISVAEARALVDTACQSIVHDNSGKLSTASADSTGYYPYNYVRVIDCGGTSYLQILYSLKFALEESESSENYLMSVEEIDYEPKQVLKYYLGYKLTGNGVVGDLVIWNSLTGYIRVYCELTWGDEEKTEWKLDFLGSEVMEEFEQYDAKDTHEYACRMIVTGNKEEVSECELSMFTPNKSLYYDLTTNDVSEVCYWYINANTHAMVYKDSREVGGTYPSYKDKNGYPITITGFTDEEVTNIISEVQTFFKNSWTPKMMLKTFKESDFENKALEVVQKINEQMHNA